MLNPAERAYLDRRGPLCVYRVDQVDAGPVEVRLPDGTTTTDMPLDVACTIADPPAGPTSYLLALTNRGAAIDPIHQVMTITPGDSFTMTTDRLFDRPTAQEIAAAALGGVFGAAELRQLAAAAAAIAPAAASLQPWGRLVDLLEAAAPPAT